MSTDILEKPIAATPGLDLSLPNPGLGQPHRVRVIRSLAEFAPLRAEWDAFLKTCGIHNLCMTHGWLTTWLQHFPPNELHILLVEDVTGQWLGAAPLQIKRSRNGLTHRLLYAVEWVGTNPSVCDWMQFAVHPQADEAAVMQTIARHLAKANWDLLELKFCLNQAQLEHLAAALPQGRNQKPVQSTVIPYLDLPATAAAYEPNRRKKTRLEVNRHKNRFLKEFDEPVQLEFQPAGEASNAILTRFFEGHIQYWADRGQKSDFQRFPKLFDFYKDMLTYSATQCGPNDAKLLLSVLTITDYQLSYHLGFWQGHSYLSHLTNYNQGFKAYSPGTIHMDELIYETIRRQGVAFEFGRGDEPYKRLWAQNKKPLWQLRIFRNPLSAAIWQIDILIKKLLKKGSE